MTNKKDKGAFYTPIVVANFMAARIAEVMHGQNRITILEPSAGDGVFVHALLNEDSLKSRIHLIDVIERDKIEIKKIASIKSKIPITCTSGDFLEHQRNIKKKYSLIIGNPPYIKKNLLFKKQIAICEEIHRASNLAGNTINNIWTSFLIRSIELLSPDGILAFVLPAELLQVKFASELRTLILSRFDRVEVFTFNELLFEDCKGQDTILLIAQKKADEKGLFVSNVNKVSDLESKEHTVKESTKLGEDKWSDFSLSSDEVELLQKIKSTLKTANHYCNSKAGIVTAANNFFIVDDDTVEQYSLHSYIKPIIQRGLFVNGSVVIGKKDFRELAESGKPTNLLCLNEDSVIKKNQKIHRYLDEGEDLELHLRFKMQQRENWYEVPNIGTPPQAFFFKRCDEYPKLIRNDAKVLATDSAYMISMNKGYNIESLIFSFYNSLTLSLAELDGRYYGGGVLELTPNEFKNLPVPYCQVSKTDFKTYTKTFEAKESINDVCGKFDQQILRSVDSKIDMDTIQKLSIIRNKLHARRIKSNR